MTSIVYLVHCVDAEGPLHESLDVKFDRLSELFDIKDIEPTDNNLEKLKSSAFSLGGKEKEVAEFLNCHNQNYLGDWPILSGMLDRVTAADFRHKVRDSFDGGWVYNWFCLDHINYDNNPRRRDIGHHAIFDRYQKRIALPDNSKDAVHWHFHPMSTYRDAHRCATHYLRSPEIFQILCQKLIDRNWFPAVYRAGFQAERPDSNWFLEQWIPFDITNMSTTNTSDLDRRADFRNGRSGDWRRAPNDWSIYHPSHDDYQAPGHCRRWIGRALNMLNSFAVIDQNEMDIAFDRASNGLPTLVGVTNHDYRDMEPEVDYVRQLALVSAGRFPQVKFRFAEALDAFQNVLWPNGINDPALELKIKFQPPTTRDVPFISVTAKKGAVFGPQPFLAIKTKSGQYIHDNMDFSEDGTTWYYAFHGDTLPLEDVDVVAVAANDSFGRQSIRRFTIKNGINFWSDSGIRKL